VSGPGRPRTAPQKARNPRSRADSGIALGLIGALGGLSQHRLIDRLIRGRIWIGLVAFALIGIVTLQLGLLRLNGNIGRAIEHEAVLQRENATLSIENSELAAGERVAARAAHLGMVLVPSGALSFLASHPQSDVTRAAATLSSSARSTASSAEGAEASSGASPAAGTESNESQTGETAESQPRSESSASTPSSAPSGESSTSGSAEAAPAGSESPAPAEAAPSSTQSSVGGASETTPAGGTQSSPSGG
jgi:hypothetical protein